MTMLAELVEVVIGVDTHKDTHSAAVVDAATGAVLQRVTVGADPDGHDQLVELAEEHQGLRAWAMEGSGGYGAGLARHLAGLGEVVVELDRLDRLDRLVRPARRAGPSPIRSTPNEPPVTCCPARTWLSPRLDRNGPRCSCT